LIRSHFIFNNEQKSKIKCKRIMVSCNIIKVRQKNSTIVYYNKFDNLTLECTKNKNYKIKEK